MKYSTPVILAAIALILLLFSYLNNQEQRGKEWGPETTPTVNFRNHTIDAGLLVYSPSFAIAAVDIDGDYRDDLLVGNHGYPPHLYLNRDGEMLDASAAVPITERSDRHGYTVVDLDNDGDRDFLYAGGGQDGIGKGADNEVYRNLLVEQGELAFVRDPITDSLALPKWRARQFLPLASPGGDKVDLYLTSLHKRRKETTNLYITNNSTSEAIRLEIDHDSSLNQRFESNGMDLFFDYDRDGQVDFLRLGQLKVQMYKNYGGVFRHEPSALDAITRVVSAAVADFDNDGFPDLYLGGVSGHTHSDNVSNNEQEIHFVVVNQEDDNLDRISFATTSDQLKINFVQHLSEEGKNRTDPGDIFLGADMKNPKSRSVTVRREEASGAPAGFEQAGTYIWFEAQEGLWHVVWKHTANTKGDSKGIIASQGITGLAKDQLEILPLREVRDYVVINHEGQRWEALRLGALEHNQWTNDVTAADFNNDGFVDIIGVRSHDYARENGTPFIMLNEGGFEFRRETVLDNVEDDIFRADVIAHGFFNDDGLPDVFFTNGAGLLPSHRGPYQFWLNESDSSNAFLLLELTGTTANRDAIGAQVELYDAQDELIGYREIGAAYGRSQDTHKVHFGLGSNEGPYGLNIRWPGQSQPQALALQEGGFYHITQGEPAIIDHVGGALTEERQTQ